ncbi:hypothetical protein BDK89_0168 [Ilumatobacter fluminis]|uniref:Zinc ribbon domain-containing protein n=1 Tax=Ilumatobacter fluminis TaxID=467091 RepID=A0A4R7HWT1_9ACTN|nr:hypothetical protein [Ilumatobacter fluminis]TDT14613.1 hypothetical protein BDK89_0168 [Ilumatobacter fluminis]
MSEQSEAVRCAACGEQVPPRPFCGRCGAELPPAGGGAAAPTAGSVVAGSSGGSKALIGVAVLGALAVIIGGVVWWTSRSGGDDQELRTQPVAAADDDDDDETLPTPPPSTTAATTTPTTVDPAFDAPVGARPLPADESGRFAVPSEPTTLDVSTMSCPGLLAEIDADSCIELETDDAVFALSGTPGEGTTLLRVFRLATTEERIIATEVLTGDPLAGELPAGAESEVDVAQISTPSGGAFVVRASERDADDRVTGWATFLRPAGDGAEVIGVIEEGPTDVAVDDGLILVASDRPGNEDVLLTTIHPVPDGWVGVREVLGRSAADDATASGTPAPWTNVGSFSGPPVPTTTQAPATIAPDTGGSAGGSGPSTGGSGVACDGSWIAVIASLPGNQVGGSLANNPGARALENEETCASLNPRFSTGANAGLPIWVVYYGPFISLGDAQQTCINLGHVSANTCYSAPLTNSVADRSVRYGPFD